jgi:hypothetical protein
VSAESRLFRFAQVEFPWRLGPPDGRYLLRPEDDPGGPAAHVIVFATLGAPERRRLAALRRSPRAAPPEPPPEPVSTGRATVIEVGEPFAGPETARAWLDAAGEDELAAGLRVLNRALHAFRLVTADPDVHTVGRGQALTSRVGYGVGEEVADGLWTDAREIPLSVGRSRRERVLQPQARLAAVLSGRESPLACEELTLRARQDIDHNRPREAALQLLVALDAAVAELSRDATAGALNDRLTELRGQREPAAAAAQAALGGALSESERETVAFTLGRIEAALRARAVQNA